MRIILSFILMIQSSLIWGDSSHTHQDLKTIFKEVLSENLSQLQQFDDQEYSAYMNKIAQQLKEIDPLKAQELSLLADPKFRVFLMKNYEQLLQDESENGVGFFFFGFALPWCTLLIPFIAQRGDFGPLQALKDCWKDYLHWSLKSFSAHESEQL